MPGRTTRRLIMAVIGVGVTGFLGRVAIANDGLSPSQIALGLCALVFGYLVIRLTQAFADANPEHRARARWGLMVAAVVPALVLTPTALDAARPRLTSLILLASAVWAAFAISGTSYLLMKATRKAPSPKDAPQLQLHATPGARRRHCLAHPRRRGQIVYRSTKP